MIDSNVSFRQEISVDYKKLWEPMYYSHKGSGIVWLALSPRVMQGCHSKGSSLKRIYHTKSRGIYFMHVIGFTFKVVGVSACSNDVYSTMLIIHRLEYQLI